MILLCFRNGNSVLIMLIYGPARVSGSVMSSKVL